MLTKKLSRKKQSELLETLFGFYFENDILIDDNGDEFYGTGSNCQFDFSTLAGIFSYTAHRAKKQGYADAQSRMRQVLGISN